jgi:hypothetical protein
MWTRCAKGFEASPPCGGRKVRSAWEDAEREEVICMNSRISSIRLCGEDERILSWIQRFNKRSEEILKARVVKHR